MFFKIVIVFFVAFLFFSLLIFSVSYAIDSGGRVLNQVESKSSKPINTAPPFKHPDIIIIKNTEKTPIKINGTKTVFIKKIQLKNVKLIKNHIVNSIISKYFNKSLTLLQMNQIASDITGLYKKEGYILSYAYIPSQEIRDNVLQIYAVEPTIEDVKVTGNKSYSVNFVKKYIEQVKKDPSLNINTLERQLLILNNYPNLNVKVSLEQGKDPATTNIVAIVTDSSPVSVFLIYDNFGAKTTSKNRIRTTIGANNIFTSGDYFTIRGLTGLDNIDFNKLSYVRADYLLPIGYNGLQMDVYYANSLYKAGQEYQKLDINGTIDIAGMYLVYPLIKKINSSFDLKAEFVYKNINDYYMAETADKDRIRELNFAAIYDFTDKLHGKNVFNLTYYQGLSGFLGASSRNDSEASRLNVDAAFNKFTLDTARIQQLSRYNFLVLKASGQYSNSSLFQAELFYIGGAGGVRGFKPASLSGDSGYLLSSELQFEPISPDTIVFSNQKLGNTFKFVVFADHGGVFRNNVQPGENKHSFQSSLGLGLCFYYGRRLAVRLDWAVPKIDGNFKAKNSTAYIATTLSF